MYLFWGITLLILILFFCINYFRKKKIIKHLRTTCMEEKCAELERFIEPFGYSYSPVRDIFSTRTDAWQRDFGYCTLYDKTAYHFNMNFDCLPVYFNYRGRTWLIEFWKGQYGINTGAEIGIYYADRILRETELEHTLFQCVEDKDMISMSLSLTQNGTFICRTNGWHWWLTAFSMGRFSEPRELTLHAALIFPNREMTDAFLSGLQKAGFPNESFITHCNTVTLTFDSSPAIKGIFHRARTRIGQWQNRFLCKLYLFVTRPFSLSVDRLLYLYYYLPFAFRRMLRIRRYRKYRTRNQ